MYIVKTDTMKELDRLTAEEYGISGLILMENAGAGAARIILEETDPLATALILCGKGNNGGDGFVVARHLANAGVKTKVLLFCESSALKGDAKTNMLAYRAMQGKIIEVTTREQFKKVHHSFHHNHVLVDALLGTGFSGEITGLYADCIKTMNNAKVPTVSLDIPSGMNGDLSEENEHAVRADHTITFGCYKPVHCLYPASEQCGRVHLAEISIPNRLIEEKADCFLITPELIHFAPRSANAHKGDFGTLLIVAGSADMAGAAILAARSAIRSGVGLCQLALPSSCTVQANTLVPEAVTLALPTNDAGRITADALEIITASEREPTALLTGPGLGKDKDTEALLSALLETFKEIPVLIDGDGLSLVQPHLEKLREREWETILTPHLGEFRTLSGIDIEEIKKDKLTHLRAFAESVHAVTLLKGAGTLVAGMEGSYVNSSGNAGMATAGSGDVLSGIIGALLARGTEPEHAAFIGAFLHGTAGDYCQAEQGDFGFSASDMVEQIPRAFTRKGLDMLHDDCGDCSQM